MAKFSVVGRLGKVSSRNGGYVSFGVAEPSYKKEGSNDYITPWFNFLLKEDSPIAKFLMANKEKIDVIEVEGNEREGKDKEGKTAYYHNIARVNVITWRKAGDVEVSAEPTDPAPQEAVVEENAEAEEYPWEAPF